MPGRRDTTSAATENATRKLTSEASSELLSRSPRAALMSGWIAPNTPAPSEIPTARIGSGSTGTSSRRDRLTSLRTTHCVLPIRRVRSNPWRSNIPTVALCRNEADVFFWTSWG